MLFNSLEFALFFPVVFALYWALKKSLFSQNVLLLIASYFFYGFWDWRFLGLIFISSAMDFVVGKKIANSTHERHSKQWLYLSLIFNLGLLFVFKYFNFFIESFVEMSHNFGFEANYHSLNIILPVGISFYTFQTLSYSIDIHRKQMDEAKNPIAFFAFVSFFPQLVAGPIERAAHLYPQFLEKRELTFEKASDGFRQILLGLFKKLVIADRTAIYVNDIYANYATANGFELAIGAIYFAFQIYGDFSGYSDIAIGTAKLLGFDLNKNFDFPYFSKNMTEHWRKWHISLSSWIRDYLFMPLSIQFRNWQKWGVIAASLLAFGINGLWHGAAWTFVVWGLLHGVVISYEALSKKRRKKWRKQISPLLYNILSWVLTFSFWCLSLVYFRITNFATANTVLQKIVTIHNYTFSTQYLKPLAIILLFVIWEFFMRKKEHALQIQDLITSKPVRWAMYYVLLFFTFYFAGSQQSFIYFQF